jgi:hypothetical protein
MLRNPRDLNGAPLGFQNAPARSIAARSFLHWESQSVTRADSETGQRYRDHVRRGSSVMLFARERAEDRAFWFLGPATYVRQEGERPMAITWRLRHALPGDQVA